MIINSMPSICHKIAYEVRYNYGFTYLDRCGSTVNEIMRNSEEWIPSTNDINPQNVPLVSLRNGTKFNFSARKYDFTLDQTQGAEKDLEKSDIDTFIEQASIVASTVNTRLNLNDFTREGFRIWYLFATKSKEDSENCISQLLKTDTIDNSLANALNGFIEAKNHVVIIAAGDRKFRIAIEGVECQSPLNIGSNTFNLLPRNLSRGQKDLLINREKEKKRKKINPEFAVMIDIDSFVEIPKDVDANDFINESLKQINEKISQAFMKKKITKKQGKVIYGL